MDGRRQSVQILLRSMLVEVPAQFVKPYVKSNKNNKIDAEAIAEAVSRPTIRFVQVKQTGQVDLQALHRARDLAVNSRTRLICQMHAFCLGYGVTMRSGAGVFKLDLPKVLADEANDLTPAMRQLVGDLWVAVQQLESRIHALTRKIEAIAHRADLARRLATVPGIGPGATALLAAAGDGKQYRRARDLSAWLGLVPAQHSTGGKVTLLGISKRGSSYVRRLLIHGARSCVIHSSPDAPEVQVSNYPSEFARSKTDDETVDRRGVSLAKNTGFAPAAFI